jgi:hypothetical protein
MLRRMGLVVILLAAGACRTSIDFRSHVSLRAGHDQRLSFIDPAEPVEGVVSARLHYVTIALESAFFRNLPAIPRGGEVALGIEVQGLVEGDVVARTVVGSARALGAHRSVVFENAFATSPVVYSGRTVDISLHLRAVDAESAPAVKGRIAGAGDVARRLDPKVAQAVRLGADLFQSIVVGRAARTPAWSYAIRLQPADSTHRDKPETLLTAARHVLLLLPPPGAPIFLGRPRAHELVGKLRLSGTRLVWHETGHDYVDSPYVVLNVTRYRRYPSPDSPLRRAMARLDRFVEEGLFPQALSASRDVAREIAADRVISVAEKNLERSWLELRLARIRADTARAANRHGDELDESLRQLERLATIRFDFVEVLEPAERLDIEHRVSRLVTRVRELGPPAGRSAEALEAALKPYVDRVATARAGERENEAQIRRVRGQLSRLQSEMVRRQEDLARRLKERDRFLPKIHKQGWFWALVGAAIAGTSTALYLALRPGAQVPEPGATVPPLPRGLHVR